VTNLRETRSSDIREEQTVSPRPVEPKSEQKIVERKNYNTYRRHPSVAIQGVHCNHENFVFLIPLIFAIQTAFCIVARFGPLTVPAVWDQWSVRPRWIG
jgi:hypothetical protein